MDFSDETMDEIFKIFQVESEEIISRINNNLLSLEKNPKDKEIIFTLFRDAHSLKGAARMIGFDDVQNLAHKMEDVLGLAKDDKIAINSKVVDILYKTVDFLVEGIQDALQKKPQQNQAEIEKHISILENIQDYADFAKQNPETQDFNKSLFISNIKTINDLITDILMILMKIETENSEFISELLNSVTKLFNIFSEIGYFDIKKPLEDMKFKLEFTQKASNEITLDDAKTLHKILDNIITKIISLYDLYNIPVVDYYSVVFEKNSGGSGNVEDNKSSFAEVIKEELNPQQESMNTDIEIPDSKEIIAESINNELIQVQQSDNLLVNLKENFDKFIQNQVSIEEVLKIIGECRESFEDIDIKRILKETDKIISFSIENNLDLTPEIIAIIVQGVDFCINIVNSTGKDSDKELIFEQLEIMQQILDLQKQNKFDVTSERKERSKKVKDFSDIFNTGEIKTLRVDSQKLDGLVNQVNELTIEKIKSKNHFMLLQQITENIEEWQKSVNQGLNYLKYYERKQTVKGNGETQNLFLTKQISNLFSDNNVRIQDIYSNINKLSRKIQEDELKSDLIIDNLSSTIKNIRVLPFATIFHLFGRMVRDIAKEQGKDINFTIVGSETSADKKIIEEIKNPLIHILRNSIDHGIEQPEDRLQLGKPIVGEIILSAKQLNNKVIIEIKDDGSGINLEKIKEKAISKGFLTEDEVKKMTDSQIMNLIFVPGFSTGDEVTTISGRGIGLDVVQTTISKLNGKVQVISELNKGCCVRIELPTTMSLLNVLLVKAGGEVFAVPLEFVDVILRKTEDDFIVKNNRQHILLGDELINLYHLSNLLNIERKMSLNSKINILIIEADKQKIAICVDELLEEQEVLYKKLMPPFYKIKNISGLTTLASGDICMILNMSEIIRLALIQKNSQILSKNTQKSIENKYSNILLIGESLDVIDMEKEILKNTGYNVEYATTQIEALAKMNGKRYDLIVMDLEMSELNGIDFIERVITDEMYCDIPLVVLSSDIDEKNKEIVNKLGVKKVISKKKIDEKEFKNLVNNLLCKNKD